MLDKLPAPEILKKLLSKGGDFAEIYLEQTRNTKITCEDKKIESVVSGVDCGVGLRLIADLKTAYGFTNELTPSSLLTLASQISGFMVSKVEPSTAGKNFTRDINPSTLRPKGRNMLRVDGEQSRTINLKTQNPKQVFPIQINPADVSTDDKVVMIRKAESLAWSLDSRIVQVRVRYSDVIRHVEIANSENELVISPKTLTVLSVSVTASDGKSYHTGYHSTGGHAGYEIFTEQEIETVVRKASARAMINLTAMRATGGTMPVIISSEAGGTLVHEAVGHGLEADLACEGMSVYEGKLGQTIASNKVTVWDDPTIPGKRGSYSFDDEGTPAQKAVLIENGVLKTYLYDRLTAMKMNTKSNGHGRRESYEHRPIVRMTNTMIAPGIDDPQAIIRSVDKGLFVKMMGGGQVNTVNGDFMFEVSEGYRLEHGKIGEPLRGATLTGSGPDVLKIIDMVGNDLGFSIGTCGKDGQEAPVADAIPTIRIPELVVGGVVEN